MKPRTPFAWLVVLTISVAACGDASTSSDTARVTTSGVEGTEAVSPESSAATPTESPRSTTMEPAESPPSTPTTTTTPVTATTPSTTTTTTTTDPAIGACDADAIFRLVSGLFPENEMWNPTAIDVLQCQNGYGRVLAIADQSMCDPEFPNCLDDVLVFVKDTSGSWEVLDVGTGIECSDQSGMGPEMVAACEALDLP